MYLLALLATLLLSLVPPMVLDGTAARLARWIYRRNGARARQLRANLRVALGAEADEAEVDTVAAEVYASYGRYMMEYFTMGWPDLWRRRRRVTAVNVSPLEGGLRSGRGVVLFGIHSGNWDLAAAECARRYGPFHSAGERIRPAWLGRLMTGIRRRSGVQVYDALTAARPLLRALRRGQVVGLIADRVVIGDGVEVTLLDRMARVPRGPVLLALMTGAPLIPTNIERHSSGDVRVEFWPPVDLSGLGRNRADVAAGAQRMADQLAAMIRRGHRSWYALQPIWADAGH